MTELRDNTIPDDDIQDVCEEIAGTLEAAYDILLEIRDTALAAAIEPLDAERESLAREYAGIEEARRNLEAILPAKEREAQRAADALLLKGKRKEAEAKLAEAQEAAHAPVTMNERQREISARLEAIRSEERAIARSVFEKWLAEEVQPVIRATERGLLLTMLNGIEQSCYEFQERTGTGGSLPGEVPYRSPLLNPARFSVLTADERSPEWAAGTKWYGRR